MATSNVVFVVLVVFATIVPARRLRMGDGQ